MRAGVAQGGLVSAVLFNPYVNGPSRLVELALFWQHGCRSYVPQTIASRHLSDDVSGDFITGYGIEAFAASVL
jgi:hypothetical protein